VDIHQDSPGEALHQVQKSWPPYARLPQNVRAQSRQSWKHLRLHPDCGNALLTGWISMDCYPPREVPESEILMPDMRRRWPLADGSAAALFFEHFLEHLPFATVREHNPQEAGFLEMCQMKPGKTKVEVFKGLDRSDSWRMAMTLYVEAMRP